MIQEKLLGFCLAEKTKASFKRGTDLIGRVKKVLGVSNYAVPDRVPKQFDPFFEARNKIVHEMDLNDTKIIRLRGCIVNPIRSQSNAVFDAVVFLIRGVVEACWEAGDPS